LAAGTAIRDGVHMISSAHSFAYVAVDIPDDMTADAWRRRRVTSAKAGHVGRLERFRRRAVEAARPAPALRLRPA
jgi:hypothetical protein